MQFTATPSDNALVLPRIFVKLVGGRIRERLRRAIFVFSVLAATDRRPGIDVRRIEDVNDRLKIAQNTSICKASAKAHTKIWHHDEGGKIEKGLPAMTHHTSQIERELIASYYIRHCPDWIRYGSPDGADMRRDLMRMFQVLSAENS